MNYYDWEWAEFSELAGKTITSIEGMEVDGNDVITIITSEGDEYRMLHHQDCCENVYIESVVGDVQDLIGEPILVAEEVSESGVEDPENSWADSVTYTFYKLSTRKGYVDLRWYGSSNGYYSESVDFERKKK
jgi:hypothetical protein